MPMPITQPTLPAEGPFSDAELLFISAEPQRLFPQNQNSNFGALRSVLTSQPQEAIDLLNDLYSQMFIDTATGVNGYLGLWEDQMGLPKAPTGRTDGERRTWISARRRIGLFSKARVNRTIESFLKDEFGVPVTFDAFGVPFDAGGLALVGEGGVVAAQYRVYYDIRTFTYNVWILTTVSPDLVSMLRELNHITPAGETVVIDNTKAAVLDYGRTVLNKQPAVFFQLADFTDSSGNADNGTSTGTITNLASPGVLVAGLNDDKLSKIFDGSTGYFTFPNITALDHDDRISVEFWIKPTSITGTQTIYDKGSADIQIQMISGVITVAKTGSGTIMAATSALAAGSIYHVVVKKARDYCAIKIDTVDRSGSFTNRYYGSSGTTNYVGRLAAGGSFLNAALGRFAVYPGKLLSDAEILENYKVGKNLSV